jgi:NitT/TauT family transport system ATP-binding protein
MHMNVVRLRDTAPERAQADMLIDFNEVTARFGPLHAMGPTTLQVRKGEFLVIVGPSGCGKSTLLNLVAGTLRPSSGSVSYAGVSVSGANRDVGYITQKNYCLPWRTVEANVRLPLEFRGVPRAELNERAAGAIARVGLSGFEKAYPRQLSGGMLQRVMIAMALACEPEILMADEPTTALDVTIQAQILELMKDMRHRIGTGILLVTHDLAVVAEVADRVAVMYAGQIVEIANVRDLYGHPLHPYTQGLLASIPRLDQPSKTLTTIPGSVPNLIYPPSGCRFHPRCPYAMPICKESRPPNTLEGEGHQVACFLYHGPPTME